MYCSTSLTRTNAKRGRNEHLTDTAASNRMTNEKHSDASAVVMSTQYNAIQRPYDELRKTTVAIIERVNVRSICNVEGATVLDLACGSGFYSHSFLQWVASTVVGVDISRAMLDEARNSSDNMRSHFIEADCSTPTVYPGGPFDIVFAAWLLNYASSKSDIIEMYRNVLLNLKPGGRFIAVTPPPSSDPAALLESECRLRPLPTASGGLYTTITVDVEDGLAIDLHKDTPVGDLDFDCFHLRKSVWEAAAKEAGFGGEIEWSTTNVPSDFMENPSKYGEDSNGGASAEELATYAEVPHYGLLRITK
ncbi:hypothetical protein LTR37_019690 [Vermiconidia calcicola]|uniref:Uncharacterized protein n=1 Tax=Vermiconidia calcicola TaxID=1690605 RepID=A0ACC3MFD8_9PEZI|nr:hypothetical protein LTR37_019690 [Vermiconidia calcicola]